MAGARDRILAHEVIVGILLKYGAAPLTSKLPSHFSSAPRTSPRFTSSRRMPSRHEMQMLTLIQGGFGPIWAIC
jgi:ABC-type uncharacterized transport system permease subunit